MWRGARRTGHDHAGRYEHGDAGRGGTGHEGWYSEGLPMTRDAVVLRITEIGILPVVRAASEAEAIAVGDAVAEGGIEALEITMTVPGAVQVVKQVVQR